MSTHDFHYFLRTAERRVRVQRLVDCLGRSLRYLAGALLVAATAVAAFPSLTMGLLIALGGVGVFWLAALAAAWFRPVDESRAAGVLDQHFGLPNHTLTSQELHSEEGGGWLQLQHQDTLARLQNADWRKAWPVRWPRFSALFGVATLLLAGFFVFRVSTSAPEAPTIAKYNELADEAATIEEMFEDWDKAAERIKDPELEKLLEELRPLRGQLPQMTEREMLLALSKIENTLEVLREAAATDSLEASARDLAAAFENVDGMGALRAALRRADFAEAGKLAEKASKRLAASGAKIPQGAEQASAQMKMAAQKLGKSGRTQAAAGMQQVGQSASRKDPSGMGQGMGQLAESFAKEATRQSVCARLGLQLAQIGQCKGGIGRKPGEAGMGLSLLPKLSQGKKPGKDAGTGMDLNRFGNPAQASAARTQENLTGVAGEGESEIENAASNTPGSEAPRPGKAAQFAAYEKLSQQAIADESLPLSYRETIKRYFEAIRPEEQ